MNKLCSITAAAFIALTIALILPTPTKVLTGTPQGDAGGVMTRPSTLGRWVSMEMIVTAYCAPCEICCKGANDGITASGMPVDGPVRHWVAAPKQIPFGTVFIVPGYNSDAPAVVLDRMPGKGDKLDCYFADHQMALEFGRRTITVKYWTQENDNGN